MKEVSMRRFLSIAFLLLAVAALITWSNHSAMSRNNGPVRPEAAAAATSHTTNLKVHPHWMTADEDNEELKPLGQTPRRIERDYQRATPSLSNMEGPRALESEKVATRAFPGAGLLLEGAAIGRQETARIAGFNDADSEMTHHWTSVGPFSAIYPVAT